MTIQQFSEILGEAVHKAYDSGYRDGFYEGSNKLLDRIEKMRTDYINSDTGNEEVILDERQ